MKCEENGLYPVFHPKPYSLVNKIQDYNGSGCHINISTKKTRDDDGMDVINQIIENMK
jgi:glutamine synthetase